MMRVLILPKHEWQVKKSTSEIAIRVSYHRSVEITFYETLKNCMDTVMADEHASIEALINMHLSSMSSTTNLMNLEKSQPM